MTQHAGDVMTRALRCITGECWGREGEREGVGVERRLNKSERGRGEGSEERRKRCEGWTNIRNIGRGGGKGKEEEKPRGRDDEMVHAWMSGKRGRRGERFLV